MGVATDKLDQRRANRRAKSQPSYGSGSNSTFINRELTRDERIELYQWREDLTAVVSAWTGALADGYKINTKRDDFNDCFAAFIIPGDGADNQGYILAGRGGNPLRAVCEALFKHTEIFRGAWDTSREGRQSPDDADY